MSLDILTVSALNFYIKSIIDQDINLSNVFVEGEISNFKNHYSPRYVTGDTANTEFMANTGLYPSINKLSPNYAYVSNNFPYSIASLFKEEGY